MQRMMSCGVVLAGGRSSRMGRDKARLPLPGGTCFLEHALGLMRELPLARVLVSGDRPGGIPDPVPGTGPIGGIYGIARTVDVQGLLVIPVDMPLLRADLLAEVLEEGERSARACYFADHYFPLWLPLSPEVRNFLHSAVQGTEANSIGALLRCAGARKLDLPGMDHSFRNINTPAEYTATYPRELLQQTI